METASPVMAHDIDSLPDCSISRQPGAKKSVLMPGPYICTRLIMSYHTPEHTASPYGRDKHRWSRMLLTTTTSTVAKAFAYIDHHQVLHMCTQYEIHDQYGPGLSRKCQDSKQPETRCMAYAKVWHSVADPSQGQFWVWVRISTSVATLLSWRGARHWALISACTSTACLTLQTFPEGLL